MKSKRIAALALSLALLGGTAVPARAAFTDTAGHWAEGAILKWSEEYGIINGYDDGTFRPNDSITRGAFAGILDRFMQFQKISPASTFSDTPGTFWETPILKLHASGVYLGSNGEAVPGNSITRQQAVTMIARAFKIDGESIPLSYTDADEISSYARAPVAEMTARGFITDSYDGYFRPRDPITRAEIVNILYNMVDVLVQTPGSYTGSVEGTLMVNSAEGVELNNMDITRDLILAPGVQGPVVLSDVNISGHLINFSGVTPVIQSTEVPEEPEVPEPPEKPEKPEKPEPEQPEEGGEAEKPEKPERPHSEYPWIDPIGYDSYDGYKVPVYADVSRNPMEDGDFYWENGRLVYQGDDYRRTRFGVDVSAYQNRRCPDKVIDWEAAADDGVDFAMVRVGFRGYGSGTLNRDVYYAQNIDGAMDAGIDTGVYFFSQAITVEEAIEEAEYVLKLLEGHEISGPIAYDWEMHDSSYRVYGLDPKVATACALAFCQRIEEAGYEPMVYISKYVGYSKFNIPQLNQYPIWFPEYKTASSEELFPAFYYEIDTWQFSSKGSVAGIVGDVDMNLQFR